MKERIREKISCALGRIGRAFIAEKKIKYM